MQGPLTLLVIGHFYVMSMQGTFKVYLLMLFNTFKASCYLQNLLNIGIGQIVVTTLCPILTPPPRPP